MARHNIPRQGEIYRHFKDKLYQIVAIATHSETGEQLVIYQALYGEFKTYARPLDMFMSEVDKNKYPDEKQKYRFELQSVSQDESPQVFESPKKRIYTLIDFLDAETYREKLDIFREMRKDIDDKTISDIAASLDVVVEEGNIDERCISLLNCLTTMERFECNRLR